MISVEQNERLKEVIYETFGIFGTTKIDKAIDELTEPAPDPNTEFVGTDRLMVFGIDGRDDGNEYGLLIGIHHDSPAYQMNDGYNHETCTPYLSDTVEAIRQLMEGKVIENEDGTKIWKSKTSDTGFMKADNLDRAVNTRLDINFIAAHTWHTVDSEEE